MAQNEREKQVIQELFAMYHETYQFAYIKFSDIPEDSDIPVLEFLHTNVVVQDKISYSSLADGRDIRNVFVINTLHRNGLIGFDKNLPEYVSIWEYFMNFKPTENGLFKSKDQIKHFTTTFLTRIFNGPMKEYSFFDKIIFNTLIKSKILIRHDSSNECVDSVFRTLVEDQTA